MGRVKELLPEPDELVLLRLDMNAKFETWRLLIMSGRPSGLRGRAEEHAIDVARNEALAARNRYYDSGGT